MSKRKFKLSKKELEYLYLIKRLPISEIAILGGVNKFEPFRWFKRYGIPKRKRLSWNMGLKGVMPSGDKCSNWRGGKHLLKTGYVTLRINGKNIFEHRYVIENFLKRKLNKDEYVHHLNGIRNDNRIENLAVVSANNHEHGTLIKLQSKRIRELECVVNKIIAA